MDYSQQRLSLEIALVNLIVISLNFQLNQTNHTYCHYCYTQAAPFLLTTNKSYFCTCSERVRAAKHFISEGIKSLLSEVTLKYSYMTEDFS